MLRLAADENLNNNLIRALRRRRPDLDIVRIQDVGLSGAPDEEVLEWAAVEQRVLVTHDVATITLYAYERVDSGQAMPGVVEVAQSVPLSRAIDDLLLLAECSEQAEWEGQILYLPL